LEGQSEASASPSSETIPCYTVLVLGPFGVSRDGIALDTATWQRRSQILLKLLATSESGRRLRDEVIDLLWPEAEPEAGGRNLRYVLHMLRRDLGGGDPSPILSEREWISLNPRYEWEIDLQRFEHLASGAASDPQSLEEAMILYRGEPLLEDRYEDWAIPVRERTERTWRVVALGLAQEYRRLGVYDAAAGWAERLLEHDALDEEALQELLQALAGLDRRADAVRRYQEFERRLAEEIGVPPSTETVALVARLKAQTGPAAIHEVSEERPPPTGGFLGAIPTGPIVARDDELERLAMAADAVEAGTGRFLMLVGEPGVGKTRLAQEAMLRLRDQSFLVVTGRCYERECGIIFYPFLEVLAQACASLPPAARLDILQRRPHIQRLLTEHAAAAGHDQLQVAREVTGLLTSMADERPLALLLDDLHWADEASLALLQHLARQTRGHHVLLLATYRDAEIDREHPLRQTVRDLDREGLVERLTIRRFTEEETAALVTTTIGETEGAQDFVEFVHRRTKGNPFYVERMLRALGGHYRLVRQIGAGGMGRVFEAVDTTSGARVAAKIMFARTEADPKALQRFEQEGAVLATLAHPNIVAVHGTFLEERASCIIMELLEGHSLGQILRTVPSEPPSLLRGRGGLGGEGIPAAHKGMPLQRVKQLMRQVAAALACAHDRGIVHRDIKPDNIMVVGDDRVKVTDFGIARMLRPIDAVTTMTSTGMTMGTPLYMAPEQIEGKKVDGRADIYSLGAVLYQAVTGVPPFEGEDPLTVAISHVRDAPRPPREVNPNVPKDWEALILKALAKDPADRFQSAAALEKALAALSEGTGTGAEDARQTARIRRAVIPALAAVVVVFVALAVFAYRARSSSGSSTFGRLVAGWNLAAAPPSSLKKPAAVAVDGRGTFYVLDQDANRIKRLSSTGALLGSWGTLGSGPGQLRNPGALAVDTTGNVYVADSGNDRIQKFSSTGRLLASWGRSGSGLGQFRFPDGIALDRSGLIYVADWGNNRIQVLSPSGRPKVTNVGTFTALYTGLNHPAGLAVDAKGELYVADNGNNQIVQFGPDGITQLGAWPGSGDPTGLALDAHGNAYVTDVRASRVQLFSPSGRLLDTWKTSGGSLGPFRGPGGIAVGTGGAAYLADTGNGRILKLSSSNRWVPAWNEQSQPRRAPSPESAAVDIKGNIYVADTANAGILKLSPSGQRLAAWTVQGFGQTSFVGPIGGIAVDPQGNVYISDYDGSHILKLSATGQTLGMWGSGGVGPGLTNPQGITVDRSGNLYVVDQGNSRVQQFVAADGTFHTLWRVTNSSGGSEPYLYGVAVDRTGNLYVTDEVGDQVLKLSPQRGVVARWGNRGSGSGQLRAPQGVAVDGRGNVYVADTDNNRVQALSAAGKPLGFLPGHFTRPAGVSVDGHGDVYVADTGNHRIEKFTQ